MSQSSSNTKSSFRFFSSKEKRQAFTGFAAVTAIEALSVGLGVGIETAANTLGTMGSQSFIDFLTRIPDGSTGEEIFSTGLGTYVGLFILAVIVACSYVAYKFSLTSPHCTDVFLPPSSVTPLSSIKNPHKKFDVDSKHVRYPVRNS